MVTIIALLLPKGNPVLLKAPASLEFLTFLAYYWFCQRQLREEEKWIAAWNRTASIIRV